MFCPKDPIIPLERNKWLEEADVAYHWRMLPRQFRELDRDDQAELHAHYRINLEIEAYYNSEQAIRMERISKQK